MSEDNYNLDSEPAHPDMSLKFENSNDHSQNIKYQNQNNKVSSTKDQQLRNSMDKNTTDMILNQKDKQYKFESENGGNEQEFDIQFKQFEVIPNQLNINNTHEQEPQKIYKRKIFEKNQHQNKNEINMNENQKKKMSESMEINKQYVESVEDIQQESNQQSQDGVENQFESEIKSQVIGKRLNYKKNVKIQSQSSVNSPKQQVRNINNQINDYGERKNDTSYSNEQDIIKQQQIQIQQNNLIQIQNQQQSQSTQSDNVKNKFRITNTSERVNSQTRERKLSQTNQVNANYITFQSQPDQQTDTQQAEEQEIEQQTDYSIIQAHINNNNNYQNGNEQLNKQSNKDTSPQGKGVYSTKLAKQFDIKNNPYSVKPYTVDKNCQKRSKTISNNSVNSKVGQIPVYLTENNHFLDKLKKSQEMQNPSVIIINQIQNTENNEIIKNSTLQANQIYHHTINQLENLKQISPQLQQVQSPIEKYINIIKSQVQNNIDVKNSYTSSQNRSSQLNKSFVSSQQNTSYMALNEPSQQFSIGAKKSVPDALQNTQNLQKQCQLQMQRRISQPHQRSITQDRYDDHSKNVQQTEKKNVQPKVPEFRTNAIAELRKQVSLVNGELESERNKNAELFAKFTAFRQKFLGKIDKQLKLTAKNEFEAEIIHVEQKVKAMKKKLKAQEQELIQLKDYAEQARILQPENEKLRFEVVELKSNLDNISIKIDTKEKSISELHRALQNTNSDFAKIFQETTTFKQKIDDKQYHIERLEEQLRIANSKNLEIIKLNQDLEYYKQNQQQNQQIKIEAERKKKEYDQKLNEFNKIREENISIKLEMETQFISLKEQSQKRELEYKQLQVTLQQLSNEKEQLIQLLKDEKENKELLKSEILKYQNDIATLIKRHQQEQTLQQNKILKANNTNIENIGIQNEVKTLQTRNQMFESENTNNKKLLIEYKIQIDDLNSKIKEYQGSTMKHSDIEKQKNEFIILQREKENQQIFYEQQIKELKTQLNGEIRQTQIYGLKLENITKELQGFTNSTIPMLSNRKGQQIEQEVNNGFSPPNQTKSKRQTDKRYVVDQLNDTDQLYISQKLSTKNSILVEKKLCVQN